MAPHCWIGVHVYRDVMKCIYIFAITHYLCHNIVAQQVVIHLRQSCTCSAADPPLLICRLPGNEVCYGSKCTMNDNQEGGGGGVGKMRMAICYSKLPMVEASRKIQEAKLCTALIC